MYKHIIRPLLFKVNPETIHHFVVKILKIVFCIPGTKIIAKKVCTINNPSLKRIVWGLEFDNPVGLAAGFDKDASFFNEISNLGFSFVEIGTVTPKGQSGNIKPRSFRIPQDKALINRMGFNNLGVDEAVKKLKNRSGSVIIGGNIGKNTTTPNASAVVDYVYTFSKLYPVVDYLVVNVSCPNITDLHELQDKDSLLAILSALREERLKQDKHKPVLLKISPDLNFAQIDDVLEIIKVTGIDGVVATNTTTTRTGLSLSENEIKNIGNGGMSGAPLKNRSTDIIRYISQKTDGKLPIIGVGGIMNPSDALDKINAGATLIQLYSGFIYEGPMIAKKINKAILKDLEG